MHSGKPLQHITRALILLSGLATIVVGFLHLIKGHPKLRWPKDGEKFLADVNLEGWRNTLFSLQPSMSSELVSSRQIES